MRVFRGIGFAAATAAVVTVGLPASNAMATSADNQLPTATPGVARVATSVSDTNSGPGYVIGMGDSYMSGEAGSWATNTPNYFHNTGWNVGSPAAVYGATAVVGGSGRYKACHRSPSAAMMFQQPGWTSVNFACSGATTTTQRNVGAPATHYFKPGIDFHTPSGSIGDTGYGQAWLLKKFAQTHKAGSSKPIKAITLSIGGNNALFAPVVTQCLEDYMEGGGVPHYASWWLCRTHVRPGQPGSVPPVPSAPTLARSIGTALTNIRTAMAAGGYRAGDYRVVYQMPPAPLSPVSMLHYDEDPNRITNGGCGFFDRDINWLLTSYANLLKSAMTSAATTAASTGGMNIAMVDNTNLFNSHRLCQQGAVQNRMNGAGTPTIATRTGTEWIRGISIWDQLWWGSTYPDRLQEAMHPMYWGQRALAGCNFAAATAAGRPGLNKYACTMAGWTPTNQAQVNLAPVN